MLNVIFIIFLPSFSKKNSIEEPIVQVETYQKIIFFMYIVKNLFGQNCFTVPTLDVNLGSLALGL